MFVFCHRRRVSGRRLGLCAALLCISGWLPGIPAQAAAAEAENDLSLSQVLARVLRDSPELAVFPYYRRAAEARVLQARLRPNPELSLEVENVAGDGAFAGTDSAEVTLALSQVIELGGKRRYRQAVAQRAGDVVQRDYEIARLDVLAEAAGRFLDVARAQRLLQLAEQAAEWASQAEQAVEARFRAGGASRAELSQARIEAMRAGLAIGEAENALETARLQLAGQWGAEQADFGGARAKLFALAEPLPFTALRAALERSPQLQRYLTLDRLQQAQLDLAIAQGRQNLSVGVGVKRFEATGEQALTFEVAMPLGVSNRNQGEIAAARADLERLGRERTVTRLELFTELYRLYQQLQQARRTVDVLHRQALPEAGQALEQVRQGYRGGRFSYLQWVEARRQRLAVEREAVEAAVTFHRTVLALEQLTGVALTTSQDSDAFLSPMLDQPSQDLSQ